MALRKPTQIRRRTVNTTGRTVVHPDKGGRDGAVRHVTLVLPENPPMVMALSGYEPLPGDIDGIDNAGADPKDIAQGRDFQWAPVDGGQKIDFDITSEQYVSIATTEHYGTLLVIIEYPED